MCLNLFITTEEAIKNALSAARVGTYEAATKVTPHLTGALALYAWNAQVDMESRLKRAFSWELSGLHKL